MSLLSTPVQMALRYPEHPLIVWCDLMKRGKMTGSEVDEMSDFVATILKKRPTKSVAIVVAPFLVSEKVGGYRGEIRPGVLKCMFSKLSLMLNLWFLITNIFPQCIRGVTFMPPSPFNVTQRRRWEDKFDMKALKQSTISIRCSPPHGKRKVPLHFDGWVLMPDAGSSDNIFANCLLLQDRRIKCVSFQVELIFTWQIYKMYKYKLQNFGMSA